MVDLTFLESFAKGDRQKMKRYIQLYLNIAPSTIQKMGQNIMDEDWVQLRINAHSLKPQADYMGIPLLKEALVKLETEAEGGHQASLRDQHEKALALYRESERELLEFMEG